MTDPRHMSGADLLAALGLAPGEWVDPETGETLGTLDTCAPASIVGRRRRSCGS